jgi:uncharacterized membrane protein
MDKHPDFARAAKRWFGKSPDALGKRERHVLWRTVAHETLSQDVNEDFEKRMSMGDRIADRVAAFGGSWAFIISFCTVLLLWVVLNLALATRAFDPYPFIFLNLMLSMVAALQAPVIMMSQNRQAARDRLDAAHDYEVNLKAEIEIMALHEKLDLLRTEQIEAMLRKQQEQLDLLTQLVGRKAPE